MAAPTKAGILSFTVANRVYTYNVYVSEIKSALKRNSSPRRAAAAAAPTFARAPQRSPPRRPAMPSPPPVPASPQAPMYPDGVKVRVKFTGEHLDTRSRKRLGWDGYVVGSRGKVKAFLPVEESARTDLVGKTVPGHVLVAVDLENIVFTLTN